MMASALRASHPFEHRSPLFEVDPPVTHAPALGILAPGTAENPTHAEVRLVGETGPVLDVAPATVVPGFLDGGEWSACFGLSYRDLCVHDALTSQRIYRAGGTELRSLTGSGGIPTSRNKVARDFLDHTDGQWLWTVDTDMGFARDTVDRLVSSAEAHGALVMGALCFAALRHKPPAGHPLYAERFAIQPTVYRWVEIEHEDGREVGFRPDLDYPENAVTEVAATGAACVVIHRSALAQMRLSYGDTWYDPIVIPDGNRGRARWFSEDMSFCMRARAAGIPVYVDTAVKTTHEKGMVYLDEETFARQQVIDDLARDVSA